MATMTQDLITDLVAPADTSTLVRGAHLVGSVNLPTAEDTFRTVAAHAGTHLRRIPDGEVGERFHWILFQGARFVAGPATLLTVLASVWIAELAGPYLRSMARMACSSGSLSSTSRTSR